MKSWSGQSNGSWQAGSQGYLLERRLWAQWLMYGAAGSDTIGTEICNLNVFASNSAFWCKWCKYRNVSWHFSVCIRRRKMDWICCPVVKTGFWCHLGSKHEFRHPKEMVWTHCCLRKTEAKFGWWPSSLLRLCIRTRGVPVNVLLFFFLERPTPTLHLCWEVLTSIWTSFQELASLGLDRLKSALMALGLKCGGWVTTSSYEQQWWVQGFQIHITFVPLEEATTNETLYPTEYEAGRKKNEQMRVFLGSSELLWCQRTNKGECFLYILVPQRMFFNKFSVKVLIFGLFAVFQLVNSLSGIFSKIYLHFVHCLNYPCTV